VDLGIAGRWAIVCGSSQGLGRACAEALVGEGVNVVVNGRDAAKLDATAAELRRAAPVEVRAVVADLTHAGTVAMLLAACPAPDIVVTNNAGPKPGGIDEVTDDDLDRALDLHYRAPIALVRAVLPGMCERRFGRIVNITSAMVKSPHAEMGLSTAARAGLTALSKALSKQAIIDNVTINNLLPERFDTPRQEFLAQRMMKDQGITRDQARAQIAKTLPINRLGLPEEFGQACAFLCSAKSGFMTGQNLQLDGGSYSGLV